MSNSMLTATERVASRTYPRDAALSIHVNIQLSSAGTRFNTKLIRSTSLFYAYHNCRSPETSCDSLDFGRG